MTLQTGRHHAPRRGRSKRSAGPQAAPQQCAAWKRRRTGSRGREGMSNAMQHVAHCVLACLCASLVSVSPRAPTSLLAAAAASDASAGRSHENLRANADRRRVRVRRCKRAATSNSARRAPRARIVRYHHVSCGATSAAAAALTRELCVALRPRSRVAARSCLHAAVRECSCGYARACARACGLRCVQAQRDNVLRFRHVQQAAGRS
jgi:hypothetical protein